MNPNPFSHDFLNFYKDILFSSYLVLFFKLMLILMIMIRTMYREVKTASNKTIYLIIMNRFPIIFNYLKKIKFVNVQQLTFNVWYIYIWVISWKIYSQNFFFDEIFFLTSCFENNRQVFFSMWYLKISRYHFFKFGTRENFFFLTAHCKSSLEYKM